MTDQTNEQSLLIPRQSAADLHELLGTLLNSPAEAAITRVRALHREDYNACAWCSTNDRHTPWPCPTIQALDQPTPAPAATEATDTQKGS